MEEKLAQSLFKVAEYIHKIWEKTPRTKILNQEITMSVPESIVVYDLAVSIPPNFRSVRNPIEISAPSIVRLSAFALHPLPRTVNEVTKEFVYPVGHKTFALFPEYLPSECDLISLTTSYRIDNPSLLDDMVDRTKV